MKNLITVSIILIAGAALTFWLVSGNSDSEEIKDQEGTISYADGTYASTITYSSPGGEDIIQIELKLKDNEITSLIVTEIPGNSTSAKYQKEFGENINAEVVGKTINSVSVSRVGGASLTSDAFNDALDSIKEDAEV